MAALLVAAATPAGRATAAEPPRILSINLCADGLLLALADPDQIAALSPFATDPKLAFLAEEAATFRHDAGTAEQVIAIDPDVVLAGRFTRRATRDLLTRLGYEVVLLDPARSITDSIDQIGLVAGIVGHPDRGAALIAEIEQARTDARAGASRGTAAIYQRRGYVTGAETLSEELLATVGFANAGGRLAGGRGGFVALETIVAAPPDVLVVADADPVAEDQGSALIAHPALGRLFPPEKRIVLPERLTVCGGPALPTALRWLRDEAERVAPR